MSFARAPRPLPTSRAGYDHSWIGAVALAATLWVVGATPAGAGPLADWHVQEQGPVTVNPPPRAD